jgi:uncharacterized delta-60 repeat protein
VAVVALSVAAFGCGDGKLDPTFDGDGRLHLDVGSPAPLAFDSPADLAIDQKGRIVLTGSLSRVGEPGIDGYVARLLSDGSPDPDFNGGEAAIVNVEGSSNGLRSVVIDADGRIVVAGDRGVARLLPGGAPDPSFSGDGQATLDYDSGMSAYAVVLDDQGRIVLAGSSDTFDFTAARLLADGSPDPAFAGGGIANPPIPWLGASASAVAVDDDGRIILAGTVFDFIATHAWEALRLLPDGSIDDSFGDAGLVEVPPGGGGRGDALTDMTLDPQGRIVLAGTLRPFGDESWIGLARLLPSGDFDPGFGQGEQVRVSGFGNNDGGAAVAIDPAGRIVVAGRSFSPTAAYASALLARFTRSGVIDRSFGAGGFIRLDYRPPTGPGTGGDSASALGIDDSGRYVIAGPSQRGVLDRQLGAARFTVDYPVRKSRGR